MFGSRVCYSFYLKANMKLTLLQVVQGAGSPAGGNAGGGGKLELDIKDLAGDPSDNTVGAAAVGLLAKTVGMGRLGQTWSS